MAERMITVEVVYAGADRQTLRRVELAADSTVMQAIDASGIVGELPDGAVDPQRLGIFARKVAPDQPVHDGDRIEIYRSLQLDPMEARRRRAR
ncbi:RnfH family protein [Rhodanobacter sp. C05]|uniref:RnfH family protein n=1 Tax=Rhodanobacter sp. C05 TaxID=1945855 RepID=UPI0009841CBF|nr:RnfH family protein [Rhodanobacter sp. C05]OOG41541.1 RnfH family protein [Rhodanobacter sp. C05]